MASVKSLKAETSGQDNGFSFAEQHLRRVFGKAPLYGRITLECVFCNGQLQRVESSVNESHLCGK